ncbi:hypothetical protein BASA60_010301 [Batrachochytrium salamandrivorans]|nr:hypothetical protein BASA60_010301 [Batrachochytrium salamandrivorans]
MASMATQLQATTQEQGGTEYDQPEIHIQFTAASPEPNNISTKDIHQSLPELSDNPPTPTDFRPTESDASLDVRPEHEDVSSASEVSRSSVGFPGTDLPARMNLPLIPTAPQRSFDQYGFYQGTHDASSTHSVYSLSEADRRKYIDMETEWLGLLANWEVASKKKRNRIKRICRIGIPDSIRGNAWSAMAGVAEFRKQGLYESLVNSQEAPLIFETIERDIHRCYPDHIMFSQKDGEGQKNLRKVLRAYALYNTELGYCQGMGMIVGLLLMRMQPEDTFWLLVAILQNYIKGYHSVNLYELRVDASAFELALQKYLKPIANYMTKLEVSPLTYMTQWFLTLYTMALPWRTVLRVWDMFFCDGPKALLRVGMGILSAKKSYLIKQCPTSSDAIGYLLQVPREFDDADALLKIFTGHRIQSGLVPAIQKSRLRLLGRALDPGVENVYTWLRGGVLNGEADLDQRWLDGTVEHESMGTRHDNRALAARLADFLQVAYGQYQSTLWKYHRDRIVEVG